MAQKHIVGKLYQTHVVLCATTKTLTRIPHKRARLHYDGALEFCCPLHSRTESRIQMSFEWFASFSAQTCSVCPPNLLANGYAMVVVTFYFFPRLCARARALLLSLLLRDPRVSCACNGAAARWGSAVVVRLMGHEIGNTKPAVRWVRSSACKKDGQVNQNTISDFLDDEGTGTSHRWHTASTGHLMVWRKVRAVSQWILVWQIDRSCLCLSRWRGQPIIP